MDVGARVVGAALCNRSRTLKSTSQRWYPILSRGPPRAPQPGVNDLAAPRRTPFIAFLSRFTTENRRLVTLSDNGIAVRFRAMLWYSPHAEQLIHCAAQASTLGCR